jgi:glycosyltransferase involved in cell wall biosynthesis
MRLCIVVPYLTPYIRGNEYGLAQALSRMGHSVTIITSRGKAPREKMVTTEDFLNDYGFAVKCLPTFLDFGDNPVVRGVTVTNCDVVLLQEDYPFVCHQAYSRAKRCGLPTMLSSERTYYPQNLAKRAVLRFLDRTSNRRLREGVDVLTVHCSAAKDFLQSELGVSRDIEVVHTGVDTNVFRPTDRKSYLGAGDPRILTTARLHKYKGLGYLIEAMKMVTQKLPQARLYVRGRGPEEGMLKAQVTGLDLEEHVAFLEETVPNYEMPHLYSECDIYAQPSVVEPYGIAVLEAMACGKPVVGTKVGGMLDTVVDGVTGFLVAPRDPRQLAHAIVELGDARARHSMGANARERIVETFDWMVVAARYDQLIKRLSSGTQGNRAC